MWIANEQESGAARACDQSENFHLQVGRILKFVN
jgi:hypothetical protein